MNKINILDKHTAQLIAAGEVVERPASVVKELLENSIDSKATRITIEIKNGGVKYIKISDNGSGIYRDDVKNAFMRHATSKLKKAEDLNEINSLGFRGEALASVCAVSQTELITKTEEESGGTRYRIESGAGGELEDIGCTNGTTIIVRNLFYNTPARMKFLKKDVAEANSCAGVIDKLALSHPEISFKFVREGKEVLHTSGDGKTSSAIYAVYGKEFFQGMIPVDYELNHIKVSGFVSKPLCAKASRSFQNFFINGRYVKSKVCSNAVEEAFKNSIMVGKFPYCVIYVDISPEFMDVNVHPAKTEIKFINEKNIFEVIYYAVKSALMTEDKQTAFSLESEVFSTTKSSEVKIENDRLPLAEFGYKDFCFKGESLSIHKEPTVLKTYPHITESVVGKESNPQINFCVDDKNINAASEANCIDFDFTKILQINDKSNESLKKSFENNSFFEENSEQRIKIIGEIFDCYVIMECGKDMVLVDKHAAHERIIFEKMKRNQGKNESQELLEPIILTLEKEEYGAIIENLDLLYETGYVVEDFGRGSVVVRSVPMYIGLAEVEDSVIEVAHYIMDNKKSIDIRKLDWIYYNIACRSAIKGGKSSSLEEIEDLIRKLINNPEIKYCPHGRPVFVSLTKKFIEKQFGRV